MGQSAVERKYLNTLLKCSVNQHNFVGSPQKPAWELDCPLCGGRKARLVWMDSRSTYKFFCPGHRSRHNCGWSGEFQVLLKVWNRPLWVQYLQEREDEGTAGAGFNCPKASRVNPSRKSRRRLDWGNHQVHTQPNAGPEQGEAGAS